MNETENAHTYLDLRRAVLHWLALGRLGEPDDDAPLHDPQEETAAFQALVQALGLNIIDEVGRLPRWNPVWWVYRDGAPEEGGGLFAAPSSREAIEAYREEIGEEEDPADWEEAMEEGPFSACRMSEEDLTAYRESELRCEARRCLRREGGK